MHVGGRSGGGGGRDLHRRIHQQQNGVGWRWLLTSSQSLSQIPSASIDSNPRQEVTSRDMSSRVHSELPSIPKMSTWTVSRYPMADEAGTESSVSPRPTVEIKNRTGSSVKDSREFVYQKHQQRRRTRREEGKQRKSKSAR